jgi:hypothetical protein
MFVSPIRITADTTESAYYLLLGSYARKDGMKIDGSREHETTLDKKSAWVHCHGNYVGSDMFECTYGWVIPNISFTEP